MNCPRFLLRRLPQQLDSEKRLRLSPGGGVAFRVVEWDFRVKAKSDGPSYGVTQTLSLSHGQGQNPPEEVFRDIMLELRALERLVVPSLAPAHVIEVLRLAAVFPQGYGAFLDAHAGGGFANRRDLDFVLEDLNFLVAFGLLENPVELEDFCENKLAVKDRILRSRVRGGFEAEAIVAIAGAHRTGTTWMESLARAVLQAGGRETYKGTHPNRYLSESETLALELEPSAASGLHLAGLPGQTGITKTTHNPVDFPVWLDGFAGGPLPIFLSVVRDPRNVVLSRIAFFKELSDPDTHADLVQLVRGYMRSQIELRAMVRAHGACEFSYEMLLMQPAPQIRRLADFLKVELGAAAVDRVVASTAFAAQSGGRAYGVLLDGDSRRGGSNWRSELSAEQKSRLRAELGSELADFGYAD